MRDVKEAFERVKLDMFYLNENLTTLREEVSDIRAQLNSFQDKETEKQFVKKRSFSLNFKPFFTREYSFLFVLGDKTNTSTGNEGVETKQTNIKTDNLYFTPLKDQIYPISIGNEGVKTDRQTYKQTDKQQSKSSDNQQKGININHFDTQKDTKEGLDETENILNSLDSLKKELRLKFKRLTDQELLVFSTIYQLEEQMGYSDYKMLSKKLKLTESSIRDYVRRLLSKKIPLEKRKVNNKEINLFISPNLKKILPLDSLLRLVNL